MRRCAAPPPRVINESQKSLVKRARRWIPWVILLALAAILLSSWQRIAAFDWKTFRQVFENIHWGWMSLSLLLILGTYIGRVLRWQVMIRHLAKDTSSWRIFKATAIGFTAIVVLGRPGELVRPWLIAKSEGTTFPAQMAAWFLERIFDLLAVLALLGFGLWQYEGGKGESVGPAIQWIFNTGGGVVAVLASACLIILFFAGRSNELFVERLSGALTFLNEPLKSRLAHLIRSFAAGMASCSRLSDLLLLFFYTAVEWVVITGSVACLFKAFRASAHLTPMDVVVYLGFSAFGSIVQIPGVGGGMQVVGTLVMTQLFGVRAEEATGIVLMNWAVSWVSILPFGLALAAAQGLRWSSLRQIEKEVESES